MATSPDIGGAIQITPSTMTSCGPYNYFGNIQCNNNFQVSLAAGLGVPHYSIQISALVIFADSGTLQPGKAINIS